MRLSIMQRIKDEGVKFLVTNDDQTVIALEELDSVFAEMVALINDGKTGAKRLDRPEVMAAVGRSVGTHTLKLISTRAEQHVLRFPGCGLMAFPNAGYSRAMKVLFRPFNLPGANRPVTVASCVVEGGAEAERVIAAARAAFGAEAFDAFVDAVRQPRIIATLRSGADSRIPVLFVPNPRDDGATDIQVTPVSTVESYVVSRNSKAPFFLPDERDATGTLIRRQRRARFVENAVTGSPQNITSMIGGHRAIICAEFPDVMDDQRAALLRYAKGGNLPQLADDTLDAMALRLVNFADALDRTGRKPAIVAALTNISRGMADIAAAHVRDMIDEAARIEPGFRPTEIRLDDVIMRAVRFDGTQDERRARAGRLREIVASKIHRDATAAAQQAVDQTTATTREAEGAA